MSEYIFPTLKYSSLYPFGSIQRFGQLCRAELSIVTILHRCKYKLQRFFNYTRTQRVKQGEPFGNRVPTIGVTLRQAVVAFIRSPRDGVSKSWLQSFRGVSAWPPSSLRVKNRGNSSIQCPRLAQIAQSGDSRRRSQPHHSLR